MSSNDSQSAQPDATGDVAQDETTDLETGGAQPASFSELDSGAAQGEMAGGASDVDLNLILNVKVDLALEVGRANVSVRDLLKLNHGSVVELDRLAGEPLDVLINGTLIARGEVVVVNDNYGIRLTEVVSPSDRLKQIQ